MWILTEQLITSPFVQDTKELEWDSETFGQMCEKSLMWRSKPSQSRTWQQRLKRVGYIQHLFTRILKPSHSNTFLEKWISSLPDSRANPLVLPEDENQQMIRDIYTHTSLKESHSADQLMLFSKMSKESSQAKPQTENRYSSMSSETWKKEVISHRGEYSARLKLVRPINEKESLSWPTARNSDAEGGRIETEMSEKGFRSKRHKSDQYFGAKLRDAVETHEEKNWPTPTLAESSGGKRTKQIKEGKWHNIQLREAIDLENEKNWATPQAMDGRSDVRKPEERSEKAKKGGCSNLREQVHNWPTPKARDWKGGMGTSKERQKRDLDKIVHLPNTQQDQEKSSTSGKSQESWGTPAVNDANKTPHCEINSKQAGLSKSVGIMESQKSSKKLNPNWVEQLMGLPVGWTQLPTEWID